MTRIPLVRTLFVAAAVATVTPLAGSAQVGPETPIPMDQAIRSGELDNGLRYFIRENGRPEARAELRLVVDVGSVLEDDSQRGLAHLLEHMAFNGTESFEKQELVDYLESIGMAFGPSINAGTSFDETVYMLRVPTDDAEALDTGLRILEEWAHRITLDPAEVDAERGVVIEEWRLGRGAAARISDQQLPIMFAGSRYADRLPIGEVDVLESFPQEEIERFYDDWYRPELMSVIAVGDFEADTVEARIRELFSQVPPKPDAPERVYYEVPPREETGYAIAVDPEATSARIGFLAMQEPRVTETVADYRQSLIENLANAMLNQRFQELTQQADPPFLAAITARGSFVRTASAYQLLALVPEDGHARGFETLLTEAERAARHGFTEGELARAKADLQSAFERQYAERENRESSSYASEYVRHALTGEQVPGIDFEYAASQALIPTITLDDVNAVAQANLDPANRVIMADGTEKPGVELPTPQELEAIIASVEGSTIEPYVDTAVDEPLVAEVPAPGSIVSERELPEVGVTEWTLSNGAVVWLKPTDFKDDEIVFTATSPGGWSRSTLEEHWSAQNAAGIAQMGGVGPFSRIDLDKALAGKTASVSASIGETSEGMSGSTSPRDLETLFQLVWLRFTAPREDSTAFAAMRAQMEAVLANRSASPQAAFADTVGVTMTRNHPRAQPPSMAMVEAMELGEAVDFYRDRFASADDFHFTFVGAFDLETMRPLVEQWLAPLPAVERDDSWVDLDIDPPTGVVEKTVRKGVEPQSQTLLVFTGPFDYTALDRIRIRAMAQVLEVRLRETLREDLGGTYSVGVNASYEDVPESRYTLQIQFGADPERAEELRAAVMAEIERLQTEGPTALDVEKAVEGERRSWETAQETNPWWASNLTGAASRGADPAYLLDESRFDAITMENVQADAQRYLDLANYVVVTLLPATPIG